MKVKWRKQMPAMRAKVAMRTNNETLSSHIYFYNRNHNLYARFNIIRVNIELLQHRIHIKFCDRATETLKKEVKLILISYKMHCVSIQRLPTLVVVSFHKSGLVADRQLSTTPVYNINVYSSSSQLVKLQGFQLEKELHDTTYPTANPCRFKNFFIFDEKFSYQTLRFNQFERIQSTFMYF